MPPHKLIHHHIVQKKLQICWNINQQPILWDNHNDNCRALFFYLVLLHLLLVKNNICAFDFEVDKVICKKYPFQCFDDVGLAAGRASEL